MSDVVKSGELKFDVSFVFENGQQIGGHVGLLAAKSPVFEAMFNHDMQESKTRQVKIIDVDPDTFEHLLYFMHYGKKKVPLTEPLAQSLYVASDKYAVVDLNEECVQFLQSSIKAENVVSMLIWAQQFHIDKIKEKCISFAIEKGSDVFLYGMDSWQKLSECNMELRSLLIGTILNKVCTSVKINYSFILEN